MVQIKNTLNFLSKLFIIYNFFHSHHIFASSKLVIPFSHYNFNSDSFVQNNLQYLIYTEIQAGTYDSFPQGKKMTIFLNMRKSNFLISDQKICPSTSFYNKNESTSYQFKNGLSQDSFYFYNDIQSSKIEKFNDISFIYKEENEKKIFCGEIGFDLISKINSEKDNFLYNLKRNNYINNYYISFNFNEKKAFDDYDNLKGKIIIGELPHEYNKDKYNEEFFHQDSVSIGEINNYNFVFDKIYVGLKDKEKRILDLDKEKSILKVYLEISYGLISGPDLYQNYIEENFFNKTEISNICKKTKDFGNFLDYNIFICDNEIKSKFDLFPDLIFFNQNFNYNFTFNYEDLFMLKNNKYYFKVIFVGGLNNWRFGLPFFLKYQLVFNHDSKLIGFYSENIKKNEEKSILKSIWFWIVIFVVICGIIIVTAFVSKKLFGNNNRRKKANELDDGYDYEAHKEGKNDNENKLFGNEENNNY